MQSASEDICWCGRAVWEHGERWQPTWEASHEIRSEDDA